MLLSSPFPLSFVLTTTCILALQPSSPEIGWQYAGYHVLNWRTPHACATAAARTPRPGNDPANDPNAPDPTPETPPDNMPADEGGGGGAGTPEDDGQDFALPDDGAVTRRWKRSAWGVFGALLLTGTVLYVLYAQSPRLRDALLNMRERVPFALPSSLTLPALALPSHLSFKPSALLPRALNRRKGYTRFRPSSERLSSWAAEESVPFDGEDGFAEDTDLGAGGPDDFMVGAKAGVAVQRSEERVPLAPSPRAFAAGAGGRPPVKGYGSAG